MAALFVVVGGGGCLSYITLYALAGGEVMGEV